MDNKKEEKKTEEKRPEERKVSRHTWIGDEDELKAAPDRSSELSRATLTGIPDENSVLSAKTRLVEKQKKPYSGFITDEELKAGNEIIRIDDRKTIVMDRLERIGEDKKTAPVKKPSTRTIRIADERKFRRLIAILAVFAVLLAFEISYFAMKASLAGLPDKTQKAIAETEAVQAENAKLKEESAGYGEYEDVKEQKESWERLRDKLAE